MQLKHLALAAAVGTVGAQRPMNTSICDYYTTALLTNNTAKNQYTLLTLVVNTAVIGNYTQPNVGIAVPGILAKGMYMGTEVNLLPYFDGALYSSNRGGSPAAVNFLDDGGAVPLMANMPANGTSSNQYKLLTHLYEYFGVLLGCSQAGMSDFPPYDGQGSQYKVHKFMALGPAELGYFITQVGMSAASFGVTKDDVTIVGNSLTKVFGGRCAPKMAVVTSQAADLQSICIAENCTEAENATCSSYEAAVKPAVANMTLAMGLGNASSTATGSGSMASSTASSTGSSASSSSSSSSSSAAGEGPRTAFSFVGLMVGAAAMAFAL